MTFPINDKRGLWDNIHAQNEAMDIFDFIYNFLISENLDEQDVLDIMARVPIEEILEVIELDEEFKDLTPEKEKRVERRVGQLAKDVLDSHEKMIKLRNKPFARHRPGVRRKAAEILKNARTKQQLAQNASDALIRTSVSKSANIQKRIEDLKKYL